MEEMYTSKQFAKIVLNNKIINANDKLHPASIANWRKIFAGTNEYFLNNDKKVSIKSLIGIEIVDYDKKKESGSKTGNSLEFNVSPNDIKRIANNIERSLNLTTVVLFKDVKTHKYVVNAEGKGEVLFFEIKKESITKTGETSRYPYSITITKGWAFLKDEGVGYNPSSFKQEYYLSARLAYNDLFDFFSDIENGIEVFKLTEGCRLRREGMNLEAETRIKNKNK